MRLLILFLREPLPGQVKTRLGRSVGSERAAIIYRAMVRILLQQLSGLERCHLRIAYSPDDAEEAVRFWILPEVMDDPSIDLDPEQISFAAQGPGDLGARLSRATRQAFQEGAREVALIGGDCIEISSRWVHAAFAQLNDRHDAVLGPTPEGGHHLLAMQRYLPELFEDILWDTPAAFQATTERAAEQAISLYTLPTLPAIDTEAGYLSALAGPLGLRLKKVVEDLEEGFS